MILSMWFLSISLRTIPMGTAYAIWTGIGAVGSVVAGIVLFGESAATLRLLSVALIVIGTIGLKLTAD
jgi:quaternary ammonium compound-resistance protein SugE